jgi:hypothetical protein
MFNKWIFVPLAAGFLLACSTDSSATVANTDPVSMKSSPAGVATFGFVDILTTLPGLLGGSYPSCVTPNAGAGGVTLTLAGCTSSTGGTLGGTLAVAPTAVAGGTDYVETFNSLAAVRSSTLQWVYAGKLDLAVRGSQATINTEPGFTLTTSDTSTTPATTTAWTFACALTTTQTSGGYSLQGDYTFTAASNNAVAVQIDPQNPLVWQNGSGFPVSGKMTITDARAGVANPGTLTAVFAPGQVTLNGGVIQL